MQDIPALFDRKLYLARQGRASGEAVELLDHRVAEELEDRLSVINHQFAHALLIAPRLPVFAKSLRRSGKIGEVVERIATAADDLALAPASYDAVFSLLDLHAVNDVPGYLAQVSHSLRPDGLAMFSFFAGETLRELRQSWLASEAETKGGATPRVAPMIDVREAGNLLSRAGLALPVSDIDKAVLRYADPIALMREIKTLGLTNVLLGRSKALVSRRLFLNAVTAYHLDHGEADGRVRATLEIAWAMAWKPHPSQQKPLKPGSAQASLAEALKGWGN